MSKHINKMKRYFYNFLYYMYDRDEKRYNEKMLDYIVKDRKKYWKYRNKRDGASIEKMIVDSKLIYLYSTKKS